MLRFLFLATLVVVPCLGFGVKTVGKLDISRYTGRWYQVYASGTVFATFERNAVCCIADYAIRKEGGVTVYNANRQKTVTGPVKNITGYAYVPDSKEPGKLKVALSGVPFAGNYWVIMLGPTDGNGAYEYSVVTDRFKLLLFVLARDVDVYMKKYDAKVQDFLKKNGFTWFWNRPRKTVQSKDCAYEKM